MKPKPFSPGPVAVLSRPKPEHLRALHRIAKHKERGLRPFFANPRNMICLREMASCKE